MAVTSSQHGPPDHATTHTQYFWRFSQFKVQDTLFQLPIRPFIQGSKTFARNHGLIIASPDLEVYTERNNCPTVVLDVDRIDFEAFLKALLPPMLPPSSMDNASYNLQTTLTTAEWISVLKLSTNWSFSSLRSTSITHLTPNILGDLSTLTVDDTIQRLIDTVLLGREFKIPAWLGACYEILTDLISEHRPLTLPEAQRLGGDTAHELQSLALRRMRVASQREGDTTTLITRVADVPSFIAELAALAEEEERFKPG